MDTEGKLGVRASICWLRRRDPGPGDGRIPRLPLQEQKVWCDSLGRVIPPILKRKELDATKLSSKKLLGGCAYLFNFPIMCHLKTPCSISIDLNMKPETNLNRVFLSF